MSYERHTWECGETITAELMNNLEGGVEEALANGGDCGCGEDYLCEGRNYSTLFDGTVTTSESEGINSGSIAFAPARPYETIPQYRITFDGVTYENVRVWRASSNNIIGAEVTQGESSVSIDWSEYPFAIGYQLIATKDAGAHSVKIEAPSYARVSSISQCFFTAVSYITQEMRPYNPTWARVDPYTTEGIEIHQLGFSIYNPYQGSDPMEYNYFTCTAELYTDAETSGWSWVVGSVTPQAWQGETPSQDTLNYIRLLIVDYLDRHGQFFHDNWSLVEDQGYFDITLL